MPLHKICSIILKVIISRCVRLDQEEETLYIKSGEYSMITIATAILAELAIMVLIGLILWQKQASKQLKLMNKMERQLQALQEELQALRDNAAGMIWDGQPESQQELEPEPWDEAQTDEPELLELEVVPVEEPEETIWNEADDSAPEETQEEAANIEPVETHFPEEIQEEMAAAECMEEHALEQPQEADAAEHQIEDMDVDADDTNVLLQFVQLAEQREEEQEQPDQRVDDEKLIDLEQTEEASEPVGYNVGKSGRIYTEEEVELLIKE